jgi:hypothetical protein
MRDFILTFPDEATAIAALPEYRIQTEDGEQWTGPIIPNCTRWIQRPIYGAEGELVTPPESVPGWHCIVRAKSISEVAQAYLVTDPTDIEPIPSGGLLVPVVPEEVSALQGMLAINAAGMAAPFNAWLSALDPITDFAAIAFFQKAATWRRDNPYLIQGATALGLTDEQLDQLFVAAAGISA